MFSHRAFTVEDRKLYADWLVTRGITASIAWDFLPPIGYVVIHKAQPVCIGFMVRCDNKTVINDGIVSDSTISKEMRNLSVEYLREVLLDEAKKFGALLVIAQTENEKLAVRLEEQGYKPFLKNVTHLGRSVWP